MNLGRCQICKGALVRELLVIHAPDRFELHAGVDPWGYRRRWIECERCGAAINVYPKTVADKLAVISSAYYEVDFVEGDIGKKYEAVMTLPETLSDNAQRVARIRNFLGGFSPYDFSASRSVLDIGAGTGVFLAKFMLEEANVGHHWRPIAIEPDPVAARHLRGLGLFDVRQSLFAEGHGFMGFDLCALNKVVEHVVDPVKLLREASRALSPAKGLLYVEVPAKETIVCRAEDDNILGALHNQLYDICSLNFAFQEAGLEPIRLERVYEPSGKISIVGFAVRPERVQALRGGGVK